MEPLFDLGLQATRWLQATYPQLEGFFRFISTLGLEEFYLAIVPLIYWSIDKRLGRNLAYVFLFTNSWNVLFKHALRGPRPFWFDSSLELWPEDSYGIPSGHAQMATAVYLFIAGWLRKGWVWFVAVLGVILMGVSRVYLGAHFIHDVVAGILISLIILIGYIIWQQRFAMPFGKRILGYRLMIAILVPIGLALLYVVIRLLIGAPDESVQWAAYIPVAELAGLEGMATAVGSLLGAGIGLTLENGRVRFKTQGSLWQRLLRFLLGIIVTLALWRGLSLIFPADPLWLGIPLRIFRYAITLLWVAYYAPMLFVRLRLAEAEPAPQITMTPP
ncbi:MAG: phosphatase PAP2 family protein [Ardenticatenaceae bacterium]|nr:phosphatase PAP2 family protein [Anaerolineales bacterium]MCB8920474.1 phosphatase PAP2 family protein [Ardenticatenaceae bacterium]MCB8989428.1 phosphatase PAP2 family protein [Ardenticatenaceae bacterium]MCB9005034.1 phosphatase PAP2 family protein [Ardenticatenaceae bacterium]